MITTEVQEKIHFDQLTRKNLNFSDDPVKMAHEFVISQIVYGGTCTVIRHAN